MHFSVRVSVPGKPLNPHEAVACATDVAEHIEKTAREKFGSYFVKGISDLDLDGETIAVINIQGVGMCDVLGGLLVNRPAKGWSMNLIVVDDGGALMLYAIDGDTAVWYGSLCGTEAKRYTEAHENGTFSYIAINYYKCSKKEVARFIELGREYRYRPATAAELSGWK